MATRKSKSIEIEEGGVMPNGDPAAREAAWDKFLAGYERAHPSKFAERKAAGAFDEIPASFKFK